MHACMCIYIRMCHASFNLINGRHFLFRRCSFHVRFLLDGVQNIPIPFTDMLYITCILYTCTSIYFYILLLFPVLRVKNRLVKATVETFC